MKIKVTYTADDEDCTPFTEVSRDYPFNVEDHDAFAALDSVTWPFEEEFGVTIDCGTDGQDVELDFAEAMQPDETTKYRELQRVLLERIDDTLMRLSNATQSKH